MEYEYKQSREEKRSHGCRISSLLLRYPADVGCEMLNRFIGDEVAAFRSYVTESYFTDEENAFLKHIENGGRRCLFLPTEIRLLITVRDTENGLLEMVTEIVSVKGGNATVLKNFSELFNAQSGYLHRVSSNKKTGQ